MKFIENIEEAQNKVIIRSHGVTKDTYKRAKELNIEVIDLTCPKVLKIHNIAQDYSKEDYYIFIIGKATHPEMIGTISFCGDYYSVIENEDEIENAIDQFKKSNKDKILIISQTTYSLETFENIVKKIKQIIPENKIEIKNTICTATKQRQEETEKIAKQAEAMIIIGGKHSSNSNKLYELAKQYCNTVLFIETEKELDLKTLNGVSKVGVMAGASTPNESITKVVEKLEKMC
jgi:(E)-4-hydroxy-3-methyl-but-2-enyl pyrophosphate reductase